MHGQTVVASPFTYPSDHVPEILRLVSLVLTEHGLEGKSDQELREHPETTSHWAAIPSGPHLKVILETAFFASLAQEEAAPVAVSLAYAPRANARHAAVGHSFRKAIPLETGMLSKLGRAIDPWRTSIAISPNAHGNLEMCGILPLGTGSREPLGARSLSGHFVVRATRPGVVEVDVRGNTLWVYSRGAGWEPSDWTRSATILARAFPAHSGDWRASLLLWLTQRIVESRHGGTLVI